MAERPAACELLSVDMSVDEIRPSWPGDSAASWSPLSSLKAVALKPVSSPTESPPTWVVESDATWVVFRFE